MNLKKDKFSQKKFRVHIWGIFALVILFSVNLAFADMNKVKVINDESGSRIQVNGKDFMINGMNWDYFPIGTNFSYSLWNQPDDIIKSALDAEMSLLKNMGVNVIRQYTGVQPKWIEYIYEKYGIYTLLNHSFGRYGLTLNGEWVAVTNYSNPATQEFLLSEVDKLVKEYKNTPGLLMYLLGNENNYGLFWAGAETEDFPDDEEEKKFVGEKRGRPMYKLMNDAAKKMKAIDSSHPVAICNGDVLFIDIVAEECTDVDVYGTNTYRGVSFGDMFQVVKEKLNKPLMFTEFGADAFNAIENAEDQKSQAYYMVGNWKEIYENASGIGKADNSIGGFTFQFSDGWWKYGQTKNLTIHDNNASWANGGYPIDLAPGENNMNEEWFGICAKGPTNQRGLYQLYPRAAYYALKEAHGINPYADGITLELLNNHFSNIELMNAVITARGDKASLLGEGTKLVRFSGLRLNMETISTGGNHITTPETAVKGKQSYPAFQGYDHMKSFYGKIDFNPAPNVTGYASFNILGHVPVNTIDEIFYENRGRSKRVQGEDEMITLKGIERVALYKADFIWDARWFNLHAFYRSGHYHWGYEGDFFGLYPEANYGPNIDIYNGIAPMGYEVDGKKSLDGITVAYGPQLWWGANPAVMMKYSKTIGHMEATVVYQKDLDEQESAVSSFAIPLPPTQKATIHLAMEKGAFGLEIGGIWSGDNKVGEEFQIADEKNGKTVMLLDEIKPEDTYGGKVKFTFQKGRLNYYAQGAAMGLVADGRTNSAITFTGWRLKDSGSGNQVNFLSGLTFILGNWQFAPNFLWQKPIVGPIPTDVPAPGRPRNILSDPFAVRGNRECTAGELLVNYDPTPGTWLFAWDNDIMEDAKFAATFGYIYRHHPTTQDAAIGIMKDGRTIFAFPGAPEARDLWESYARIVSKITPKFGLIANLFGGISESNGSDNRLVKRYGGDLRVIVGNTKLVSALKFNDWGPYDYHRDFNLTFPVQISADLSKVVGTPGWLDNTKPRFGVKVIYRTLDENSPRYEPGNGADPENGTEWEIKTYIDMNIGI